MQTYRAAKKQKKEKEKSVFSPGGRVLAQGPVRCTDLLLSLKSNLSKTFTWCGNNDAQLGNTKKQKQAKKKSI